MPIGITPELEEGVCSLCGDSTKVRAVIDGERGLIAKICPSCATKSSITGEELLDKYGKPDPAASKADILKEEEWKQSSPVRIVPKN